MIFSPVVKRIVKDRIYWYSPALGFSLVLLKLMNKVKGNSRFDLIRDTEYDLELEFEWPVSVITAVSGKLHENVIKLPISPKFSIGVERMAFKRKSNETAASVI